MQTFADFGIVTTGRQNGSGEVQTTCPQCSPSRRKKRDKCLSVNVLKNVWKCYHCGWTGSLKLDQENTPRRSYTAMKPATPKKDYTKPALTPTGELSEKALKFFTDRGITPEVLKRNKITSTTRWLPQHGKEVEAVAFPYLKVGEVVNAKYRGPGKAFTQEKDAEKIFFGFDDIDPDCTIIVEGEMDKLALEVADFTNAISVPDGAPPANTENYATKFDYLVNCEDALTHVKRFVIATDNDAPGLKLRDELARRLGKHRCEYVTWPEGCKDANDVLVKHGIEGVVDLVSNSKPFPVEGVLELDVAEIMRHFTEGGGLKPGLSPGWPKLAELYTVQPGEITVITGAPNSGKSEFLDAILVNLGTAQDWRFMVFSPENAPTETIHVPKLIEKYTGKSAEANNGNRMSMQECQKGLLWVKEHFRFFDTSNHEANLERILEVAGQLVFRYGINGLVIDPWNEVEHDRQGMSETDYISLALQKIRRFARHHGVHVWIVAHPKKMEKEKPENGKPSTRYVTPTPYDISGSANWFNKPDNCLAVNRSFTSGEPVIVYVQKVRFKHNGKRGAVEFLYNPNCGRYLEARA